MLTSTDGSVQALEVSARPARCRAADFTAPGGERRYHPVAGDRVRLPGRLILNVMPCVLPILAMKALALATPWPGRPRRKLFLCAGAVLSFAVLGLAIVLLRAGGAAIGWGFQLQSPIAVAGFALLVFAVGLNLSGLFEVGSVTAGEGLASRGGLAGAFFTGVLAVAVAAPCTAPFMAAALGFALTQGALSGAGGVRGAGRGLCAAVPAAGHLAARCWPSCPSPAPGC